MFWSWGSPPLSPFIFLLFFGLDRELAEWGFLLASQLLGYSALSFCLGRRESPVALRGGILPLILLCLMLYGLRLYAFQEISFLDPWQLAAIFSGSCVLFISLEKRTLTGYMLTFILYSVLALFVSVWLSSAAGKAGIPIEGMVFLLFLIGGICFICLIQKIFQLTPNTVQALIPILFSALFFFLEELPALEGLPLLKWLKGLDLLLLLVGLLLLIFNENRQGGDGEGS